MPRLSPLGAVRDRLALPGGAPYPRWLVDLARTRVDDPRADAFVYLAWELSRALASGSSPADAEALQALVVLLLADLGEGNTRLPLDSLPRRLAAFGASEEVALRAQAIAAPEGAAETLIGIGGEDMPLIRDGDHLYLKRVHRAECALAERLRDLLSAKQDRSEFKGILEALDAVLAHRAVLGGQPIRLSTEQQQAVRTALTSPLTVICGGPGRGKTAIVVAVLRVLARLGIDRNEVVLAAPGVRAAVRLENAVREHLEAIPEPGRADRSLLDSLPEPRDVLDVEGAGARLVIAVEAERIDVEAMESLFRALHPGSKLVLLGDVDQLASVEAGGVFRELLHRARGAIALKENHRAREIAPVVRAVAEGNGDALFRSTRGAIAVRERANDVRFEGVELLVSDEEGFVERWYERCVRVPKPQCHRVLAATRSDATRWDERLERCGGFPRREASISHAETVRDAQGSRFDRAAVVLPEPGHPLLFRHFLVSALTAALESVTLLGTREAVLSAVATVPERSSGLPERIGRR
jgi:ATP-dependent exoDNAse (exonuclease V) alpha subunit